MVDSKLTAFLELKKAIEQAKPAIRVLSVFTHFDQLSDENQKAVSFIIDRDVTPATDVVKCAKTCKTEEMCEHWTEDTIRHFRRVLANLNAMTTKFGVE